MFSLFSAPFVALVYKFKLACISRNVMIFLGLWSLVDHNNLFSFCGIQMDRLMIKSNYFLFHFCPLRSQLLGSATKIPSGPYLVGASSRM